MELEALLHEIENSKELLDYMLFNGYVLMACENPSELAFVRHYAAVWVKINVKFYSFFR